MNKEIAVFINGLSGGGAERVCTTVVNHMCKEGYRITLLVTNLNDQIYLKEINKKVNIIDLKAKSMKGTISKIKKYLKQSGIKKVLSFNYELTIILLFLRRIYKLDFKIISRNINTLSVERQHEKSVFRKLIVHNLVKLFYKQTDLLIAQSKGMATDLVENYGFDEKKIIVINNPVSEKVRRYSEEVRESIFNKDTIIYVGRLTKQKGLNMLLEAFKKLDDKSVKLLIIGEGECKEQLQAYAKELDIELNVEFINFSTEIEKYFNNAKFTVLTSYYEGFPNVLVESITMGTPVVAYDCPSGPSEIIINEVNGMLVEYLNIDDLVKKMKKALKYKWDEYEIKKTSERYYKEAIISKYIEVIESI